MAPPGPGKLLSFQELPPGRVFLLNPGKLEAHHQLNKAFRQYVRQEHRIFLQQYVVAPYNNRSTDSMLLLRQACSKIILEWLAFHNKDLFFLEYQPAQQAYAVTLHLEHLCRIPLQTNRMQDLIEEVHSYILRLSKSFCHEAWHHISKFLFGRGVWMCKRKFRIKPLTEDDKIALEKSRAGQFSDVKLSQRKEQFGSTGRKALPPVSPEAPTPGGEAKRLVQTTIMFSRCRQGHLSLGKLSQVGHDRLTKWLSRKDAKVDDLRFLSEYSMLEAIHKRLIHVHKLYPLKM
jgi:hypothetical protein